MEGREIISNLAKVSGFCGIMKMIKFNSKILNVKYRNRESEGYASVLKSADLRIVKQLKQLFFIILFIFYNLTTCTWYCFIAKYFQHIFLRFLGSRFGDYDFNNET